MSLTKTKLVFPFITVLFLSFLIINAGYAHSSPEKAEDNALICNVSWTTTNSSLSISGLDAPHTIFKLFNPNWTTNFSCLDNCTNPLILTGLTTGATYFISYNLYNDNWQPICDDLVAVTITGSGPTQADLTLADLRSPGEGEAGALVNFSIDLINTGTALASGDYQLKFYLSTDNTLSPNDTEVGFINTGNTPIGTIEDVPSAITIPSNFAVGNYYLIGIADSNNDIAESNENNNTISQVFQVKAGAGPGDECGFFKSYVLPDGRPLGVSGVIETADEYRLTNIGRYFQGTYQERKVVLTLDKEGNELSITDNTSPETPFSTDLNIALNADFDIAVSREDGNGNLLWETIISFQSDIPAGFDIIGASNLDILPVHDGYLVQSTIVANDGSMNDFYQATAKLDANGSLVQKNFYLMGYALDLLSHNKLLISNSEGYVYNVYEFGRYSFVKYGPNGEFLWRTVYTSDLPSNQFAGVKASADERYVYGANRNNLKAILDKVDVATGQKVYKLRLGDVFSAAGDFTFEFIQGFILTPDGGVVTGFLYTFPGSQEEGFEYGKIDADGNVVWEHDIPFGQGDPFNLTPQIQTADGGFLFSSSGYVNGGEYRVMKMTSNGELTPTCGNIDPGIPLDCDLSYTLDNGLLEISGDGLNAAHVIIKVFTPSWGTAFDCFDNCGATISLANLTSGTYHLAVDLYDDNWQRTCSFLTDIPVNGPVPRGIEEKRDQFQSVLIDNLYPIPASDQISMEVSVLEENNYEAQIFDARGALVAAKMIPLNAGANTFTWDISFLPAGMYQVLFKSNNRQKPIRFVKQSL